MTGADLIAKERERQIKEKNYTAEHDDLFVNGELAKAGACHAVYGIEGDDTYVVDGIGTGSGVPEDAYPWEPEHDTRENHNRIENLIVAGAYIAAEIDRLLRLEASLSNGVVCAE